MSNYNKKLITFIIIILLITLGLSTFKVIKYIVDENGIINELNNIDTKTEVIETTIEAEIINQETEIPKDNPYWKYINMNLIDVDLNELKKINKDVVGWIQVNGTNINYPFVQTSNNDYYLNHSFNKSWNYAGWIFLDYRNVHKDEKNTIIYGHGMKDKTMFGTLRNSLTNGWLNDPLNFVIKLSTEEENTLWQVFSAYHIPTTSDYIQTNFDSDEEFESFVNMLKDRSAHDFKTNVSYQDRIITLSTCYNSTDRVVLHAKLIKKSKNQ